MIRALCERDFRRPAGSAAGLKLAQKDPDAAKPPKAPAPARRRARHGPPSRLRGPRPRNPSPAFRSRASSSLADAKGLLARLKKKSPALLAGLTTEVATVEVDGKTVNRALISGFGAPTEASQFCEKLKAGGQACFVRR